MSIRDPEEFKDRRIIPKSWKPAPRAYFALPRIEVDGEVYELSAICSREEDARVQVFWRKRISDTNN